MKVSELIEGLKTADPDAAVLIQSGNPELNGATVAVRGFIKEQREQTMERFRDMMDYSGYHAEVYRLVAKGGEEVIRLY